MSQLFQLRGGLPELQLCNSRPAFQLWLHKRVQFQPVNVQDRLTTWIEYLGFETWCHRCYAKSVNHLQEMFDEAWRTLQRSGVLKEGETPAVLHSFEFQVPLGTDCDRLQSAAASDSPAKSLYQSFEQRVGAIDDFCKKTNHYWWAHTRAEWYASLLQWIADQIPSLEHPSRKKRGRGQDDATSHGKRRRLDMVERPVMRPLRRSERLAQLRKTERVGPLLRSSAMLKAGGYSPIWMAMRLPLTL